MRAHRGFGICIALLLVLSLGLTACGGGQPAASPSPSTSASKAAQPSPSSSQSTAPSASASTSASTKAPAGDPIKFGALVPFTGRYAPMGEPSKKAIDLTEEYINKQGGIAGRPLKMIVYDDEADQAKAAQLADRLINQDKVVAIIGPIPTANAQAVTEIAERAKVIDIYQNPTSSIWVNKKYIFQATANDKLEIARMIQIMKKLGKQNVGILHDANPYGTTAAGVLQEEGGKAGLKFTGVEKYGGEDRDMSPQLTKLKNAGSDVLAIIGVNPAPTIATKQTKQLGINVPIITTSASNNPQFIELAGDAAEGVYSVSFFNPDAPNPALKILAEAHRAKYNQDINSYSVNSWDAIMLIKAGLDKAGGKTDGDSIAAALESLTNYVGAAGTRNLSKTDHNGMGMDAVWPQVVKGGKWVLVPE